MVSIGEDIHVLHVGDEPEAAELAATFIEREDERFVVETAGDASAGLDRLADGEFDCVVSDYDMPGRNGIEFLRTVRDRYPELPFVLYTGEGDEGVASEAISAGVTDYLRKEPRTEQYTVLATRLLNAVVQRRGQQQAAEVRQQLQDLSEVSTDALWMFTHDWSELLYVNSQYEELWGRSADALAEDPLDFLNGVHPADRDTVRTAMERLSDGDTVDIEYRVNADEAYQRWVWTQGIPLTDETGRVSRVAGFVRDITDRKRREQELRDEQAFIEQSLNTLDDIFYFVDTDGDFERWNTALSELTGYSDEEIGSMNAVAFFEGEHREAIRHSIGEILTNGFHVTEAEITTADGRQVPHEFRGVRMTGDDGEPTGIIGIARDITDRLEYERRLKQKTDQLEQLATRYEVQYRTLFEEAPVMTVLTRSEDGRPIIEDCNSQFAETLGYDAETMIGNELAAFYTPDSAEQLLSGGYSRSLDGQFTREQRELVTNDGAVVEALLRAVPRHTAADEVIGTVAMYIDITERESVRRANERLEEFTSVVSHDLRNPLNVATGRLELAAEECDSAHLDRLGRALDRMGTLIDDLLTLSREGREVTDPQPVDLPTISNGCWENVETDEAALTVTADRSVRADRSRLKQVFENLFRNAVEHGGKDVTVTVGELDDGFYVADDGPGIPPGERDEVFEAGYSESANGTGFGLSIVKQVVTAHNWQISVTDGANGGARFEITDVESGAP